MSYAIVELADGTQLQWGDVDVAIGVGRYERVSNLIRSRIAVLLDQLADTLSFGRPFWATFDNAPRIDASGGTAVTPILTNALDAVVHVAWRSADRISVQGIRTDRYRFRGEVEVTFRAPILHGDAIVISACDYIEESLRETDDGEVRWRGSTRTLPFQLGWNVQSRLQIAAGWAATVSVAFYIDEDNDQLAYSNDQAQPIGGNDVASVVRSRFKTMVQDQLGLRTVYDNAPYRGPNNATWMQVNVMHGASDWYTIGATTRTYIENGTVQVLIFTPALRGDAPALAVADVIWDAFHQVADSGVRFGTPALEYSGLSDAYWQVAVRIPYSFEAVQ